MGPSGTVTGLDMTKQQLQVPSRRHANPLYTCCILAGIGISSFKHKGWYALQVAERHVEEYTRKLGYQQPNMRFTEGHMEYLDKAGIADSSVDLVISNCVINLSPDKPRVLAEAFRVLEDGGELYFSDVYSDRRLPEAARADKVWLSVPSLCLQSTSIGSI